MKRLLLFTLVVAGLMFTACSKHNSDSPSMTMGNMPRWLELPETSEADAYDFFHHKEAFEQKIVRNWSFYWDYGNRISRWVAYPLYKSIYSGASRTDEWGYDPLLPYDKQQNVSGSYREGNNGWYAWNQLLPSSDRKYFNETTFYSTNIAPMNQNFQSGIMTNLEVKIRSWADQSDTCYVVSGCICNGAKYYVVDRSGNKITVPTAFFKAILRYKQWATAGTDGFCAAAFLFDHEEYSMPDKSSLSPSRSMSISVSELETILGYKLFVNLASVVGEEKAFAIKQENPRDNPWWW